MSRRSTGGMADPKDLATCADHARPRLQKRGAPLMQHVYEKLTMRGGRLTLIEIEHTAS